VNPSGAFYGPPRSLLEVIAALAEGRRSVLLLPTPDDGESPVLSGAFPHAGEVEVVGVPQRALMGDHEQLREWLGSVDLSSAEFVALVPPFGRMDRAARHDRSEIAAANVLAVLPPSCDFLAAFPRTILAGGRSEAPIGRVLRERHLRAVVELAGSSVLGGVDPRFRACLVHLSPVAPDTVAFLSIAETELEPRDLGKQLNELRSGRPRTTAGFALASAGLDLDSGILPAQLDPETERRLAEAVAIGELRRVDELFDVIRGARPTLRTRSEPEQGDLPVLTARRMRAGRVTTADEPEWCPAADGTELLAGDLVVRAIGDPRRPLVVAEVTEEDLPLVVGRNLLALRPKPPLGSAERTVLRGFLGSHRFALQLRSRQVGSVQLNLSEIASALVPVPDPDLREAFATVEAATEAFEAWAAEGRELLAMSLDAEDLNQARTQLLAASALLRQRASAGALLDDLGHRIATRFPLPLAYRWRIAMAARGGSDELDAILRTQEVTLSYLATLALVSAREGDLELGHLKDLRSRLGTRRAGISLGDWRAILAEVAQSRAFRRLDDAHPLVEVRSYFATPDVVEASDRLTELRHGRAHLRELAPGELANTLSGAWRDLEQLITAAEWITDYPLLRIMETRWDSLDRTNLVLFRELAGDSPVVPLAEMHSGSNDVEAGSLYVRSGRGDLLLMRPFMLGEDCPSCGHWSTFLPDRTRNSGFVEYKSLEHGHSIETTESVSRALSQVGLLES
jgi:hypothetical protein